MKKLVAVGAFVIILSASLLAQSSKDAAAVRKVMDEQVVAWNAGNIEAFMFGYRKSESLRLISDDRITLGWQQTLDNYKKTYSTGALMGKLSFSDLDITVLSKDSAFVVGSWSLARDKDNPKGKFTLLFRKFKEGWRIVTDHTS